MILSKNIHKSVLINVQESPGLNVMRDLYESQQSGAGCKVFLLVITNLLHSGEITFFITSSVIVTT